MRASSWSSATGLARERFRLDLAGRRARVSRCELTDMYSPTAIDIAPATSRGDSGDDHVVARRCSPRRRRSPARRSTRCRRWHREPRPGATAPVGCGGVRRCQWRWADTAVVKLSLAACSAPSLLRRPSCPKPSSSPPPARRSAAPTRARWSIAVPTTSPRSSSTRCLDKVPAARPRADRRRHLGLRPARRRGRAQRRPASPRSSPASTSPA